MSDVTFERIEKRYAGRAAVADLNLRVKSGELVCLLGPSGCGKTTTLRMLAGFLTPDSGDIRIGERSMLALGPEARPTAMVFQRYTLWPHMNVFHNVAFGLKLRRLSPAFIRQKVKDALTLVGLPGMEGRQPSQLSGGQQQRVALARALVLEPEVLLLDEPLSSLDAKLRVQLRDEIRGIVRELGITTVFVTHDQEEAMAVADRIAVMHEGVLHQVQTPGELYDRPATRFVADFIGQMNFLPGQPGAAGATVRRAAGVRRANSGGRRRGGGAPGGRAVRRGGPSGAGVAGERSGPLPRGAVPTGGRTGPRSHDGLRGQDRTAADTARAGAPRAGLCGWSAAGRRRAAACRARRVMNFQARTQAPYLLERHRQGVLRTAHGGASRAAPDNTLEAIAATLLTELDFVEVDVHLTRDGELLLWHDTQMVTPDDLFEIARHSLAELRDLQLIDGTLATLPEVIELLRGHSGLMIDLKAPALEEPIAAALRASRFIDVVVCGDYLETLERLKTELPQIGVSLTPDVPFYLQPGTQLQTLPFLDAVTVYWRAVGPALMQAAQEHGVLVLAWTVDHPHIAAHLLAQGVHGLTSNNMVVLEGAQPVVLP